MSDARRPQRLHIGLFGRRNAGKSSLCNALCGQDAALVSPVPGTTTDPVEKVMELAPLGPVVLLDTPAMRIKAGGGTILRMETSNPVVSFLMGNTTALKVTEEDIEELRSLVCG